MDVLLNWTPVVALIVGVIVYFSHRHALRCGVTHAASLGVQQTGFPVVESSAATVAEGCHPARQALPAPRRVAHLALLRHVRNEEHNWLIPDNVQEEPAKVAARISPTNLGFLLNARQVACEFGYLTVPEFVAQTMRTLDTVARLPGERGHLYNWYDTRTLGGVKPTLYFDRGQRKPGRVADHPEGRLPGIACNGRC